MYFIQKEGVNPRGIFWVGLSLDAGKQKCKELAEEDIDGYHTWVLYQFNGEDLDPAEDAAHKELFWAQKGGEQKRTPISPAEALAIFNSLVLDLSPKEIPLKKV